MKYVIIGILVIVISIGFIIYSWKKAREDGYIYWSDYRGGTWWVKNYKQSFMGEESIGFKLKEIPIVLIRYWLNRDEKEKYWQFYEKNIGGHAVEDVSEDYIRFVASGF